MKLKIGIAGLRRGRTWINIFSKDNRSSIVALCDKDQSLLEEFPADKKFTNIRDLLAMDLDAIVICTPPTCHAEQTVLALGSGKHVLCEKPIAIDPREADEMVNAAKSSGAKLAINQQNHVNPGIRKAQQMIAEGVIGDLVLVRGRNKSGRKSGNEFMETVSYTHLTLPTNREV